MSWLSEASPAAYLELLVCAVSSVFPTSPFKGGNLTPWKSNGRLARPAHAWADHLAYICPTYDDMGHRLNHSRDRSQESLTHSPIHLRTRARKPVFPAVWGLEILSHLVILLYFIFLQWRRTKEIGENQLDKFSTPWSASGIKKKLCIGP